MVSIGEKEFLWAVTVWAVAAYMCLAYGVTEEISKELRIPVLAAPSSLSSESIQLV